MNTLLPKNFNELISNAVKHFWKSRSLTKNNSQEGSRGSVIGGKNLVGFSNLIKTVAHFCGFKDECVIISGNKNLTIPGYFRPTKMWDSIVIYKGRLIAAFELKSQVGSFGNNFNNRSEESIGSATDFWTAYREKIFEISNYSKQLFEKVEKSDYKKPFLGYLMLLEECVDSTSNVKVEEEHFKVFPHFKNASYAKRYQILCEKLVLDSLYSSACLIMSNKISGLNKGAFSSPTVSLSPKSLFADFASKLIAAKEIY